MKLICGFALLCLSGWIKGMAIGVGIIVTVIVLHVAVAVIVIRQVPFSFLANCI